MIFREEKIVQSNFSISLINFYITCLFIVQLFVSVCLTSLDSLRTGTLSFYF